MATIYHNAVDKVMELAIRDGVAHYSDAVSALKAEKGTILFKNGLNQNVTIQVEGSYTPDFTDTWDVGTPVVVNTGTNGVKVLPADYYPYYRIEVTAALAPANGTFYAWATKYQRNR